MLWRDLRTWQIYGANTDVGKTVLSTILCKALARRASANGLLYLKPVSTGPQGEADDRHIKRHVAGIKSRCISQFAEPVSPHLAAKDFAHSHKVVSSDSDILSKVKDVLNNHSHTGGRYALLETAGGVLSPAPSGTVQADLYRPLRLPVLLMGDSKLGGIGTTISAFESLHIRGYDVESVLLFDDTKWGNHEYLQEHFSKHGIQTYALPMPPARQENRQDDRAALSEYYDKCASGTTINNLISALHQRHFSRISNLTSLSSHAESLIWHPFRQHQIPQNIIAIDSAYGDHFQAYNPESDVVLNTSEDTSISGLTPASSNVPQPPLLTPLFDASASWWTQGLGHGNSTLSLAAANAAGRYGHVMFANAIHEPALDLSYNLLSTIQNPRSSRVFFTDNGSTGMEVAVKMALRATCQRYGWNKNDAEQPVGILGLKGSYHGDTIGVMNCSEPNIYNEQVDWYKPWGHWFEPPEVKLKDGSWQVQLPTEMSDGSNVKTFPSLSSIFDFSSRQSDAEQYRTYITKTLHHLTHTQHRRFGALILEPLIMGAGGMIVVDPLFQRTLITTIRENPSLIAPDHTQNDLQAQQISPIATQASKLNWSGLPFIADEVFTGLYRLGRPSSSSFLNNTPSTSQAQPQDLEISPDISVHAKLLTGGLLPLALTTASDSIFQTFLSDSKADALLHGHSYTAHPVGCAVANKSLETMKDMDKDGSWTAYKDPWTDSASQSTSKEPTSGPTQSLFSFFDPDILVSFSKHPRIDSCFALGTVLSLSLKAEGEAGYSSTAAASLQASLLTTLDEEGSGVHSRVLGNVIYFMTSLTTRPEQVRRLENSIMEALDVEV